MNRNLLRISVSIVALVLALAFCMTGCKVDDVTADLDTVKGEVNANKADATKALDDAVRTLNAKISTNEANCAAEIAKLVEAIDAAKAVGETDLAKAEETLNEAVALIRTDLEEAKKALNDKIVANDTKLNNEIADLKSALENAIKVVELADIESLAQLAVTVAECDAALETAIDAVAKDVEALTEYIKSAEKDLNDKIAEGNKNLTADVAKLQTAIQVAVANANSANEELKAELEQALADATKTIVDAVEIIKTDLQGKIDALEETTGTSTTDIAALKAALGNLAVEKDENGVVTNDVVAQLQVLNNALANYKLATEEVVEAWHAIKLTYQLWNECAKSYGDMYIVENGQKVDIDLEKEYNSAQVRLYRALSVEEVEKIKNDFFTIIDNIQSDAIDALKNIYQYLLAAETELNKDEPALADVKANLNNAKNGVPYEAGVHAAEYGLVDFEEAKLIVAGAVVDLNDMYDALLAKYNEYRASIIMNALNTANDGIVAAEKIDDLADYKAILDAQQTAIEELAADGYDATELNEKYDAVVDAYYAKYVDFYATGLTERMNGFIDNLGAIYAEVNSDAELNEIQEIAKDYMEFIDNREYRKALRREDSKALKALEAAAEKFNTVEEQLEELTALVAEGEKVAEILVNSEFDEINGTKTEFEIIKSYRVASAEWLAKLDSFCEAFTANETNEVAKAEIKKVINEDGFNTINDAFEAKIAKFIEAAEKVAAAVEALKAEIADGYKLTTVEAVDTAWDAVWNWMGLAEDEDGIAFIIEWKSNGALTQENLISTVNAIDVEYKAFLAGARSEWTDAYTTPAVAEITTTNLTVYEDRLVAVRSWFDKYGIVDVSYAEEHELYGIGTSDINTEIVALEEALVKLIEAAAAKAKELQERIDTLGTITTDSKETVETLRNDYDTWVVIYSIEVNNARNEELGLAVNIEALLNAEEKLAELERAVAEIKKLVADLEAPELGNVLSQPYFEDENAKNLYVAAVNEITTKLATFKTRNDGYRDCFTDEELTKVDDCALYAVKYDSLVKAYEAYVAVKGEGDDAITDATIIAKMDNYLDELRGQVDGYDSTTANVTAIIKSMGNGAQAQFVDIAAGRV